MYRDLKRGWRVTSPNLEQCGLLQIEYSSLDQNCSEDQEWAGCHAALATASKDTLIRVAITMLDYMRRELAIHVDYLDREIQERIRPFLEEIPGADIRFRAIQWGPPTAAPILIKIVGPEIDVLRGITARVKETMGAIDGIVDIKDDFSDAAPELRVNIDRKRAAAMGIPLEWVATTLRGATAGLDIREFRDELDVSKKYDLKLRFSPESRTSPRMLEKVKVRSDTGNLVPLTTIANYSQGEGLNSIRHSDRRRIVRISANNRGRSAVEITQELVTTLEQMELPAGYTFDYSGEYEETAESFGSLRLAYIVSAILIFTLLVSQFNSIAQPFAILTALPLSIVGAMAGLYVTGNNFSLSLIHISEPTRPTT